MIKFNRTSNLLEVNVFTVFEVLLLSGSIIQLFFGKAKCFCSEVSSICLASI